MSVVSRRQTAAGDQNAIAVARQEGAIGDGIGAGIGDVGPARIASLVMILDRGATARNAVREAARRQDVLAAHLIVAKDAPRLAHADPRRGADEHGGFVAGRHRLEEAEILEGLRASLGLSSRNALNIVRRHARHARHDRRHNAPVWRAMNAALLARQREATADVSLAHQSVELLLLQRQRTFVDVGDSEGRGQRLLRAVATGEFVIAAGAGDDVGVACSVDHHLRRHDVGAALVDEGEPGHAIAVGDGAGDEAVQQHAYACLAGEVVPHPFECLGIVGDARAGAKGLRPAQRHVIRVDALDDLVGKTGDHLLLRLARRIEGVHRIEHGRADAAKEAATLDEQRPRSVARAGDSRDHAGASRPGDHHVDFIIHRTLQKHADRGQALSRTNMRA